MADRKRLKSVRKRKRQKNTAERYSPNEKPEKPIGIQTKGRKTYSRVGIEKGNGDGFARSSRFLESGLRSGSQFFMPFVLDFFHLRQEVVPGLSCAVKVKGSFALFYQHVSLVDLYLAIYVRFTDLRKNHRLRKRPRRRKRRTT